VLGAWCAEHLPGTPVVAAAVARAAARAGRPLRPAGPVPSTHWAAVGGALGQRLVFLVQHAPPYYALYGLVGAGMVSRAWADAAAAVWPTHTPLPPEARARALECRPTPTGWVDLGPGADPGTPPTPVEPLLAEFLARLVAYLGRHAPPGQLGTPGVEAGLARACWVLAAAESAYRGGALPETLATLLTRPDSTVEDLRGLAAAPVVDELARLAVLTSTSGALDRLRALAGHPAPGQPLGHAGPVFVPHWADGDLLLGPDRHGGYTLVDVKTVLRVDDPARIGRWLWQILAYAWLDVPDRWRIRTVGLYLARHGLLLTWPLPDLETALTGSPTAAAQARRAFLAAAEQVLCAETAAARPGR